MITPTAGLLRKPRRKDLMSANMVLSLHPVVEEFSSAALRDELFAEVGLQHLPKPEEPVREKQVRDLHQEIRRRFVDDWPAIMQAGGERAAEIVATYRIPPRARTLMRKMPWPLASWLLIKSTEQHAWTFAGSGEFRLIKTSLFELADNPVTRGENTNHRVCTFQKVLFQSLFRRLVHRTLTCTELTCCAQGDETCRFELGMERKGTFVSLF